MVKKIQGNMIGPDELGGKRRWEVPHVYTILLSIIMLAGVLSYIIPAGEYQRVTINGIKAVDPNTFQYIPNTPVSFFDWFVAIPRGMASSIAIMAIIFIPVGAVNVYTASGAFQAAIAHLLKRGGSKGSLAIMIGLMSFFAFRAGFEGAIDTHLAFVPLTIGFALAAGYDVLTGVAITMVPTFVSFALGPTNPYTVLISQEIAGLPPFSGLPLRLAAWGVVMALTYYHVLRYAIRVKREPSLSIVQDVDTAGMAIDVEEYTKEPLTTRKKILVAMLLGTIVVIVTGALKFGWYLNQMTAAFLISGILAGIVAGFDNKKIANLFVEGGSKVYFGAMCVAVARAIQVVLEDGHIIDTIIHALATILQNVPGTISVLAMYVLQLLINFFIPSGSGQAMATMPILAPLSDVIGVTRQTAVLAFQFGDGITNLVFPTMGLIFAYIAFGGISYEKYLKFIFPLMWKVLAVGAIFLVIAHAISYGPF